MCVIFEKPGQDNTAKTLEIALQEATRRGIKHIVIASTWGETALAAVKLFSAANMNVVFVTHNTGFNKPGEQQLPDAVRKEVESKGMKVLTSTAPFRALGRAIKDRQGFCEEELVANTLRMFGQGMKVCAEITAMASDAGLVPPEDIIAVAGTGKGADTAVVVKADSSNRFFDIKIREILAKPGDF
jgi:hypothetical protein